MVESPRRNCIPAPALAGQGLPCDMLRADHGLAIDHFPIQCDLQPSLGNRLAESR